MENNIVIKKVLTSKEAREYLGCSEYTFEQEIKKGNISFKQAGRIRLFPIWVLEKWLNDTQNHIDFSKEAARTTRTSHTLSTEKEYSLENLAKHLLSKKPSNTALKGYRSLTKHQKHQMDQFV